MLPDQRPEQSSSKVKLLKRANCTHPRTGRNWPVMSVNPTCEIVIAPPAESRAGSRPLELYCVAGCASIEWRTTHVPSDWHTTRLCTNFGSAWSREDGGSLSR